MMDQFQKEYNEIIEDYSEYLKEVSLIVEKILVLNEISIAFPISGRNKTLKSIEEKITSKRFTPKKSITELNDLVGLRIVLLFRDYKDIVVRILSKEFVLLNDPEKNPQKPDQFGYSSIHLILKVKDAWLSTPNWKSHGEKKIEIQIRTLSEHIWAETSHKLFYKNENIPESLKRDLSKLSALLEISDDHLQSLKFKVEQHVQYVRNAPFHEILELDLNSESFRRVMIQNSDGLYKLNDIDNKLLSYQVERDFNIVSAKYFNDLIQGKIILKGLNEATFIQKVFEIIAKEKKEHELINPEKG